MTTTEWFKSSTGDWVLVEVINNKRMPIGIGRVSKTDDGYVTSMYFQAEPRKVFDNLEEAKTWMQVVWRMKHDKNS